LLALEREPFHSAWSFTEAVDVAYSTNTHHQWDSLGMKYFHLRWIPHELISDVHRRLEFCGRLLPVLEPRDLDSFRMFGTWDEDWFVLECQHPTKWSAARGDVPTRVNQMTGTETLC
jgi:hypothetical protein